MLFLYLKGCQIADNLSEGMTSEEAEKNAVTDLSLIHIYSLDALRQETGEDGFDLERLYMKIEGQAEKYGRN